MGIAIVDYGMGNLHSVGKAVERLGFEGIVTGDERENSGGRWRCVARRGRLRRCDGASTRNRIDAVVQQAAASGKPLLGICLGMQLLFDESEEHGLSTGLGILPGRVVRFQGGDYKVPHMGWNRLEFKQPDSPLLAGLTEGHVYFVHSYHVLPERGDDLLAVTDYGHPVTAIVGRGNVYGMQFHPEKSSELGMALLGNFLSLAEGRGGTEPTN